MNYIKYIISLTLLCSGLFAFAQQINPNGYNIFYYDNGVKSSEGSMRDGKPDGYWKTYNKKGILKSEGNRKDFLLDSLWKFYSEEGKLLNEYTYVKGKKTGPKKTYDEKGKLSSEENFENDIKQGHTFFYYPEGMVSVKTPFKNGKEEGMAYEYDKQGTIITLITYKMGSIARQEKINRTDANNKKTGMWKTFYENGNIKTEARYENDLLNGYYKEYDPSGSLVKAEKYVNGVKDEKAEELVKLDVNVSEYFPDGRPKVVYTSKDGVKEGVERYFGDSGKVVNSKIYKMGVLVAEGIYDERGLQQGLWKEYYLNAQLKSQGEYKDGMKIGEWVWYHPNGEMEQKGKFTKKGKPDGLWRWWYDNKQLEREETYVKGKEEGDIVEYFESGKLMTKGQFEEGMETGKWEYDNGDYKEEGNYKNGVKDGLWIGYYDNGNGKKAFEGSFVDGNPHGKHIYWYDNGQVKREGEYIMGNEEGTWKHFNEDGTMALVIVYKDGQEIKIDGVKVDQEKSSKESSIDSSIKKP